MAKITCPLHSITAKGSIAKNTFTFSSHANRTIAKYVPTWTKPRSPAQVSAQNFLSLAAIYWKWLPDYAKYFWTSTTFTLPQAYDNSPWRGVIRGRLLFSRQAIMRIKLGKRPRMTPYDTGLARRFWDCDVGEFYLD